METNKRVTALEKHVAQLRKDQREIRTALGQTATKQDLRRAADQIGHKIDGGIGTVVEIVTSMLRANRHNGR